MAELIDKGALSEEIESLTVHVTGLRAGKGVLSKFMDEYRNSVLRVINEQPVTTEAEIRSNAIDEFAEKLCDAFLEKCGEVTVNGIKFDVLTLDGATEITWEVAEQLKGD